MPAKDKNYDLVSVLYHTLNGAETCETYVKDAEGDGDNELATFFRETQTQYEQLAKRAKTMLGQRL